MNIIRAKKYPDTGVLINIYIVYVYMKSHNLKRESYINQKHFSKTELLY